MYSFMSQFTTSWGPSNFIGINFKTHSYFKTMKIKIQNGLHFSDFTTEQSEREQGESSNRKLIVFLTGQCISLKVKLSNLRTSSPNATTTQKNPSQALQVQTILQRSLTLPVCYNHLENFWSWPRGRLPRVWPGCFFPRSSGGFQSAARSGIRATLRVRPPLSNTGSTAFP